MSPFTVNLYVMLSENAIGHLSKRVLVYHGIKNLLLTVERVENILYRTFFFND